MLQKSIYSTPRNSKMNLNEVYFWTNRIKDWKNLLKPDKYKQIIIDSLRNLCERQLINVYGFVIMPNHMHLIWELKRKNGKEKPNASFNKETAHLIVNDLKIYHSHVLPYFKVNEMERSIRFGKEILWQ